MISLNFTICMLKEKDAGFGVFAYHTNNSKYDERTSLPNFMHHQLINK